MTTLFVEQFAYLVIFYDVEYGAMICNVKMRKQEIKRLNVVHTVLLVLAW